MGVYDDDDNKCCHVGQPCCLYWSVILAGIIMFGVAFSTVDIGNVALLQNKFSKNITKNTLYYSGRYHIGLVSAFINRGLQWKAIEFGGGEDADSASIHSTTADAASVSLSASQLYKLKFEQLEPLYLSWPLMSSHHRDVINEVKDTITSLINSYNYAQFISDRVTIQKQMGYNIGVKLKNTYFAELTMFVLNQVILEETHENSYINLLVTTQKAVTQNYINQQNQIVAETETLAGSSASTVATTKNTADVAATEAYYTKKALGDKAYWDAYKAGLNSLKTCQGANFHATSDTTTRNLMTFLYYDKLIDANNTKIVWNTDTLPA